MKAKFDYYDGSVLKVVLEPESREESLLLQLWNQQSPEGFFRFASCGIGGDSQRYPGYRSMAICAVAEPRTAPPQPE